MEPKTLQKQDYTVGWICALPESELRASRILLDEEHEQLPLPLSTKNQYVYGTMNKHNVVMGCLPTSQLGKASAAAVAAEMDATFPNIRLRLMVGIGGGVPVEKDVRLGDVVVSQPDPKSKYGGVVQYDFGQAIHGGVFHQTGLLNQPPTILLNALSRVKSTPRKRSLFLEYLSSEDIRSEPDFALEPTQDRLFDAAYPHVSGNPSCAKCDSHYEVIRPTRLNNHPQVHYGTIASGDQLMKDPLRRDQISAQHSGVLCFEMEAAGLMNNFPCLVIRGICDYCDSHKNDDWDFQAAASAAAWAKELLRNVAPIHLSEATQVNETIKQGFSEAHSHYENEILERLPRIREATIEHYEEDGEPECLKDTRVELLQDIDEWANDPHGKIIFWLSGAAGTGKSTIARTVAKSFRRKQQLAASFFFKHGHSTRANASHFFSTIITQIVQRIPELSQHVAQRIREDPELPTKSLKEQFDELIFQPLQSLAAVQISSTVLILVIDALDECEQPSNSLARHADIDIIVQQLVRLKCISHLQMRCFVTSRPEHPVRDTFKKILDGHQNIVLHEIASELIHRDILTYLRHRLAEIRDSYCRRATEDKIPVDWPRPTRIQQLLRLASPLFIVASTICLFIADDDHHPDQRLNSYLRDTQSLQGTKYEVAYTPILNRLLEAQSRRDQLVLLDEYRKLLGTIVVLYDPLPKAALATLAGLRSDIVRRRLDKLHSVLSVPSNEHDSVMLHHLSLRDVLVQPDGDTEESAHNRFRVDGVEMHGTMARNCLSILCNTKVLKRDIFDIKNPGYDRNKISQTLINARIGPEVQYACNFWVYHLREGQQNCSEDELLGTFLKTRLLHWLEALAWLDRMSDAVRQIQSLHHLVSVDPHSDIASLSIDALHFIRRFRSGIECSPLQLYYSCLLFCPERSIVRNLYKDMSIHGCHIYSESPSTLDRNNGWQLLDKHTDLVTTVAFSPDGTSLASGSYDNTIRLWDLSTGEEPLTLEGHTGPVMAVAFFPNGKTLISASDQTVRLWNLDRVTVEESMLLEGHILPVTGVTVSFDGSLVISASRDCTIRLWDGATGRIERIITLRRAVRSISVSPKALVLASAEYGGLIRIWDLSTGNQTWSSQVKFNELSHVCFSPAGHLLCHTDDGFLQIYSLDSEWSASSIVWRRPSLPDYGLVTFAFSPNKPLLVCGAYRLGLLIYDLAVEKSPPIHVQSQAIPLSTTFSPDGGTIAHAGGSSTIRLHTTESCLALQGVDKLGDIQFLKLSKDGQLVIAQAGPLGTRLWSRSKEHQSIMWDDHSPSLSPNGQFLALQSFKGVVVWHLLPSLALTGFAFAFANVMSIATTAFSADSRFFVAASSHMARLWDLTADKEVSSLRLELYVFVGALPSSCGRLLALLTECGRILLWDVCSRRIGRTFVDTDCCWKSSMAFSTDSHLLAVVTVHSDIRLWDVHSGKRTDPPVSGLDWQACLVFSPDNQLLVALAANPGELWILNLPSGVIHRWKLEGVSRIQFTPCGQFLDTNLGILPVLPRGQNPSDQMHEKVYFINKVWITRNGQPFLWLPPAFRSRETDFRNNTITMSTENGTVVIELPGAKSTTIPACCLEAENDYDRHGALVDEHDRESVERPALMDACESAQARLERDQGLNCD